MFTGIIESIGSIRALTPKGGDVRVSIDTGKLDLSDVKLGDSIAINGVCLTAVELSGNGFAADVSRETLDCTAFNDLKSGSRVNLERAMRADGRFGGHVVQGHVDGTAACLRRQPGENWEVVTFALPPALAPYVVQKGSITLDGVSLTVSRLTPTEFDVSLIPTTLELTTLGALPVGGVVNVEVDVLAKYVERLLATRFEGADSL